MIEFTDELIRKLNNLKKQTFFELLELAGRVFIVVDYDESVVIGKRGFLPEEKERGLVLVFNSRMKFNWENDAITATLVFGSTPEKCYIPVNAIAVVFSPDLRVQLTLPVFKVSAFPYSEQKSSSEDELATEKDRDSKIIDITKLRKKK